MQTHQGNSLYMGKVDYRLCSCESTLSLAVGKEEIKSCVNLNSLVELILKNVVLIFYPNVWLSVMLTLKMLFSYISFRATDNQKYFCLHYCMSFLSHSIVYPIYYLMKLNSV